MQVSVDSSKLLLQIKKLRQEVERKMQNMVQGWTYDVTFYLAKGTPLGNAAEFPALYAQRYDDYGLEPVEGVSRGAWQVSYNGRFEEQYFYGQGTELDAASIVYDKVDRFPIGKTYYIGAQSPYMLKLEGQGRSPQLEPGGFQRLQDEAIGIYNLNLKQYYSNEV